MKKFLLILSVVLSIGSTAFADQSRHTAAYFRGLAPDYLGKKISLDVSAAQPMHRAESEKYGFLVAQTFDTRTRTDGGKIFVVSDKEELLDLVRRFGSKPDVDKGRRGVRDVDTTRLVGVLRQTDNQVLYVDLAEEEVPAEVLTELKKAMGATKKQTPAKGKGEQIPRKGGNKGK